MHICLCTDVNAWEYQWPCAVAVTGSQNCEVYNEWPTYNSEKYINTEAKYYPTSALSAIQ